MKLSETESTPLGLATNRWSSILATNLPAGVFDVASEHSGPPIPHWKRILDGSVILLFLPFVLPLSGLIMLWIKCASPGPIVFRQRRIGFRGRSFTCFKFRSMRVSADAGAHQDHVRELMNENKPLRKMDAADPRLIPLGHLLRASGLDELLQLINVLRGEMSLVGPRPCLPYEFEQYQPWQKQRCDVMPGLTGLWQVSGKNSTTFNEMIRLDLLYARDASLRLDLLIIFRTFRTVLGQVLELKTAVSGHHPNAAQFTAPDSRSRGGADCRSEPA